MNDTCNALFELVGSILLWLNVRRVWRDRSVAGLSIVPTAFFFAWGVWNLFYYPSVGCPLSFYADISVVVVNGVWVYGIWRFR